MRKRLLLLSAIFVLNALLLFGCGRSGPAGEAAGGAPEEQTNSGSDTETDESDAGEDAEADAAGNKNQDFADFVSGADPKEWDGFALIDLDGDGTDEFFATCLEGEREDPSIQPYLIVGHDQNGKVVINEALQDGIAGAGGYRGTLYYLEGMGLLHESMTFAPFGSPADTVYALRDGTIEISDSGEFSVDDFDESEEEGWDPLEHGSWTWNGESVTEEEYYGKLKEATNDTEGLPLCEIEWKNKDTILASLKGEK